MGWIVLSLIFLILAIIIPVLYFKLFEVKMNFLLSSGIRIFLLCIAILCFLATSFVHVGEKEFVQMTRIYGGDPLPQGQIVAAPWQKGPQAKILPPGFHFIPFVSVIYDIEHEPVTDVPFGKYLLLTARDGMPLEDGELCAPEWDNKNMIDAMYFMGFDAGEYNYKGPRGSRGPQLTVLPPGTYRVNTFLFTKAEGKVTTIAEGHVAVIKSNVGKTYKGKSVLPSGFDESLMSVPVVPKGFRGIWNEIIPPGAYYINELAYKPIPVPITVISWKYIGGFERRWIDLQIADDGKIVQSVRTDKIPVPQDAADMATLIRVENWDIHLDSRIQGQVPPENAPFIVAAVGGLEQVESNIITPIYRAIVRNVIATDVLEKVKDKDGNERMVRRPRKALDLLYFRQQLESEVLTELSKEGRKIGLNILSVLFGDPAVPPELLVPGKRQQLAESLSQTYRQEKIAQEQRVETERERARANKQDDLMQSLIGIQVADNNAQARRKAGDGEEAYMKAVARGQEAQATVLGKDKAFELAYLKEVMAAVKEKPEMVQMPNILVIGEGGSLSGAAAILGGSNLSLGVSPNKINKIEKVN